jgi:uncharacterized membrane protein
MNVSTNTLRIGVLSLVVLLVLELVWHAWLFPPDDHRPSMIVLTALPLALSIWIGTKNRRRGVLVGGMFCLAYFSHGVSSAYSEPVSRWLALIEVALSLVVIGALGWDSRGYRRKK